MMREAKRSRCEMRGRWKRYAPVAGAEAFHLFTGQEMPVEDVEKKFFAE